MSTAVPADSVKLSITTNALSPEELRKMNAYWRAANYLSVGQIYLYANPLLREPLKFEHTKPLLLGHWGTTPGLNFIYAHCNRVIKKYDLNMIYICGRGHGGLGLSGQYLPGRRLYVSLRWNGIDLNENCDNTIPILWANSWPFGPALTIKQSG